MEGIISDLHLAGLLDCAEGRFKLCNDPGIRSGLRCLARTFEDPLDRQGILDKVTHCEYPGRYLESAYEFG